jgi:hypothetical protein
VGHRAGVDTSGGEEKNIPSLPLLGIELYVRLKILTKSEAFTTVITSPMFDH